MIGILIWDEKTKLLVRFANPLSSLFPIALPYLHLSKNFGPICWIGVGRGNNWKRDDNGSASFRCQHASVKRKGALPIDHMALFALAHQKEMGKIVAYKYGTWKPFFQL